MRSIGVGAVVAAITIFFLGFIFYALLGTTAWDIASPETAAAVQSALGGALPGTGNYPIPTDEEAFMAGPSAIVHYVAAGGAPSMAGAMIGGFVHFLVVAFLMALGLKAMGGSFERQAQVVLWFGIAASVFMHLGDPVWYGFAWKASLFEFVADGVMFIAGGLILAKWFTSDRVVHEAPPRAM